MKNYPPLTQQSHSKNNNYNHRGVIAHISWSDVQNKGHSYTLHYQLKLILESFPGIETTKITPAIKHLEETARETLVHVTAATLNDLQLKLDQNRQNNTSHSS